MQDEGDVPSAFEIEKHLERLLRSKEFKDSPSQAKVLEFIVKSALRGEEITQRNVAAVLFPKGHRDPGTSIGRTTAFNVRDTLSEYYARAGGEDYVRITLLPGKAYKPIFSYNPRSAVDRSYRSGMQHLNMFVSSSTQRHAHRYFCDVIRAEPAHALAYAAKAEIEFREALYRAELPPDTFLSQAGRSAKEALRLDPNCWRALIIVGALRCTRFRWDTAQIAFDAALQIAPRETSEHFFYVAFLAATGRLDEGLQLSIARMREYPENPFAMLICALLHYISHDHLFAGSHDATWQVIRESGHLAVPHALLACIHYSIGLASGLYSTLVEKEIEAFHQRLGSEAFPGIAILAFSLVIAQTDNPREHAERSQQLCQRINELENKSREKYVPHLQLALAYLGAKQTDRAIVELGKACDEGDPKMIWLHLWPIFDPIRHRGDFQELVRRMSLRQNKEPLPGSTG